MPLRHCEERSDEAIFFSHQPVYTCFRAPEHMYIIFQVLRFAQNLQRCARLSLFCRLSFCAPEPRDIALHVVCCMETLYVSLRDSNKQNVFEPHSSPCAFVHTPKTSSLCAKANFFSSIYKSGVSSPN